jgi:2,3,4,5-tetrahydropyridine-2-carboxylate N-succinyltransferase
LGGSSATTLFKNRITVATVASVPMADLQALIEALWEHRANVVPDDKEARALVHQAIDLLDTGKARIAEIIDGEVVVHEWLKQAILLLFKLSSIQTQEVGPFEYADKLPLKKGYAAAGVRVVPGASARWGAFLDRDVILMPSYVNIGARVGSGTMVDTWATVGSCAQIGSNVHLSGGVGIGGVLEPPQAAPVIIEDDCLIGSRCMVVNGARVGAGSVLGAGVILTDTIPVVDAETGEEVARGSVPANCVVVQASRKREFPGGEFGLPCALIIRRLEPGEREHVNDILRGHGIAV